MALTLIELKRLHILKEENCVYPLALSVFNTKDWDDLQEAFEHSDIVFGLNKLANIELKIMSLSERYGLTLKNGKVIEKVMLEKVRNEQFVVQSFT